VSQRVHPFTEGLGGLAAMLIMIYAGYSTIYGGGNAGPVRVLHVLAASGL